MAKKTTHKTQQWIALLATVFVVGGVVAVVLSRPGAEMPGGNKIMVSDATLAGRVVVYADEEAIHVIDADEGVELRECVIAGDTQIVEVTRTGVVVGVASDDQVRMGFDCVAGDASDVSSVHVSDADGDDVQHLTFTDGKTVVLKATNGRPFREASIIGWMDASHVAVVAFRGDARQVFSVGMDGEILVLATLPELVDGFAVGGGVFWYATATPGEGIEFGPSGPSTIHRVNAEGADTVVVREESSLIETLHVSPNGMYAYVTGGTLMLGREKALVNAGTGMPIGWTDDDRLMVMGADRRVSFKTITGETEASAIQLDEGISRAWSVFLEPTAKKE